MKGYDEFKEFQKQREITKEKLDRLDEEFENMIEIAPEVALLHVEEYIFMKFTYESFVDDTEQHRKEVGTYLRNLVNKLKARIDSNKKQ